MLAVMRDVLVGTDGNVPCTLLVFDEVQQYIGDSPERSRQVYEIAEAIEKHLDGRVLLVGTGQSALTDTPLLQKNAGRFPVKIHLSDTDVETVTRKMLLLKKPDRLAAVKQTVDDMWRRDFPAPPGHRHRAAGRRPGHPGGRLSSAAGPPPVLGTTSCAPSIRAGRRPNSAPSLRIVYEAIRSTADAPLGNVIPGDFIYDQIAHDLLQSGVLLREIHEGIEQYRKDGTPEGELRARLCSLVYLINRLPHEAGLEHRRASGPRCPGRSAGRGPSSRQCGTASAGCRLAGEDGRRPAS